MRITKTPAPFTPLAQGVCFAFATDTTEGQDVEVEIINSKTEEVVATQRLCGVTEGEVNIAPYIDHFAHRQPSSYTTTTTLDEGYQAYYNIRIGECESASVPISVNRNEVESPQLLSDMPECRTLCEGESDELLLFADAGAPLSVELTPDKGSPISLSTISMSGSLRLTFVAADFPLAESVEVQFCKNEEPFATLHYHIVAPRRGEVRLAWEGDTGAIERYTFPFSRRIRREVERVRIEREPLPESVGVATQYHLHLASRYEREATIEALMQIISAPRVWIDLGESFQRVEVLNSHIEQSLLGTPGCVELELCLWRKGVSRW